VTHSTNSATHWVTVHRLHVYLIYSHVYRDSFKWVALFLQDIALKVHIHWCTCTMSHSTRTQMNESRVNKSVTYVDDDVTKKSGTRWRRLTGCLKSQVIVYKRDTINMALLRKMTYKDKASSASSRPCIHSVIIYMCTWFIHYTTCVSDLFM